MKVTERNGISKLLEIADISTNVSKLLRIIGITTWKKNRWRYMKSK